MTRAEQEEYWIKYPHTIPLILKRHQGAIQPGTVVGAVPAIAELADLLRNLISNKAYEAQYKV